MIDARIAELSYTSTPSVRVIILKAVFDASVCTLDRKNATCTYTRQGFLTDNTVHFLIYTILIKPKSLEKIREQEVAPDAPEMTHPLLS
jgi:hypothetical protein